MNANENTEQRSVPSDQVPDRSPPSRQLNARYRIFGLNEPPAGAKILGSALRSLGRRGMARNVPLMRCAFPRACACTRSQKRRDVSGHSAGNMALSCCLRWCGNGGSGHIQLKEMPAVQLDTQHMGKSASCYYQQKTLNQPFYLIEFPTCNSCPIIKYRQEAQCLECGATCNFDSVLKPVHNAASLNSVH